MPRKSKSNRSTVDTRGIPFDMDPLKFYEYKANLAYAKSRGVEWLIYRLFGPANVISVVFAIDPFAKTALSKIRISPKNRKRNVVRKSVLDDIIRSFHSNTKTQHLYRPTGKVDYYEEDSSGQTTLSVGSMSSAAYVFDTSKSTRGLGSDFGECEMHFIDLFASPWALDHNYDNLSTSESVDVKLHSSTTYSFNRFVALSDYAASVLRNANLSLARSELASSKVNLLQQAMPAARRFGLGRAIAELKDVPRSILTLRESLYSLRQTYNSMGSSSLRDKVFSLRDNASQIPSEYLSFHFGWQQLYGDIMKSLKSPERINKDINRLIERNGKLSNFSSSFKYSKGRDEDLGWLFTIGSSSYLESLRKSSRVVDEFNMHCTLQAKFDFPPSMEILFREDLFSRKLGILPTPSDLYKLVPWSWLFDWYSGLGNYLQLIEEVAKDESLVNFAFVSCKMNTKVDVAVNAVVLSSESWTSNNGSTVSHEFTRNPVTYNAVCHCKTYVRQDASSAAPLRFASTGVNLTSFQQSIIGALLMQKSKL